MPLAPTTGRVRRKRGLLAPYRRLFAPPGALAFTLGNLLARLPMGMFTVSAVLMISGATGSYALAGAVTATGLAATAVAGPLVARLVDRHGQARIALPAAALAVCGSLSLTACVHYGAPAWTLFASYAATATTPNTGGMSRARWAYLHRDDPAARHTANSFEQAADELCFMTGPVLAAFLCTSVFPEAGTLFGALFLLTGMLLFTAQRRTEPPVIGHESARTGGVGARTGDGRTRTQDEPAAGYGELTTGPALPRGRTPLRLPGMPPLLLTFLATGAVFGSLEVVTVAYADGQGQRAAAGVVLACQAAGSGLAGLCFGALRLRGPLPRRLLLSVSAMTALMLLPLLAAATAGSLVLVACVLVLAGMATAPTMVTGMTLVQNTVPAARLNEGMTLAVTALLCGVSAGAAAGGRIAEWAQGGPAGYLAPPSAALLALAVIAATSRRRPATRPGKPAAPRESAASTTPADSRETAPSREPSAAREPGTSRESAASRKPEPHPDGM